MQQKIVLPRFNVPGTRSHWATRVFWAVAVLVVAQIGVFGLIIWRQQASASSETAAIAPVTNPSGNPAPSVPASSPSTAVPAVAPVVVPAAALASANPPPAPHRSLRHRHHGAGHGRALAKAGATGGGGAKHDAVDDLLKRFK